MLSTVFENGVQKELDLNIDFNAFQKMQDAFCESNHVYAMCFDTCFRELTRFSGSEEEEDYFRRFISRELQQALVASFEDNGIENIISAEPDEPFVFFNGVAIRDDLGRLLGVMMVLGIAGELLTSEDVVPKDVRTTSYNDFNSSVGLMEILMLHYFSAKMRGDRLETQLEEKELSGNHMRTLLRRNETLTSVLKRMESDNDFAKIAEDILGDIGSFMELSNASLLRLNPDEHTVDMICEWVGRGGKSSISKFFGVEKSTIPFFTGRPYTISSDAILPENFQAYFLNYNISAGVFLPLLVNDKLGMYVCFTMGEEEKKWSVDDVKLLNDIKVVLQTILVKRVTKNSLASSYAALDAILENAGCGICVNDVKAKTVLYTNETFHHIFDNIRDRQDFERMLLSSTEPIENIGEYYTQQSQKWYQISFSNIHWVDGREVRLSTIYDITDVKNYQQKIEEQASTDFLTGLYNRMQFEKDLKSAIRDAVRSGEQGTFVYLDLDDFKDINDGLGHSEGDEFLQKTGAALETICRGKATCYRLGGDEFAIIIPATSRDFTESIIGTVQRRFSELWNLGDSEYFCTACLGVVSFPKDGTKVNVLMQRADIALYSAKQKGKNKIEYYSKTNDREAVHRLDMERAMRKAVEEDCEEFEVFYQPLMDASNLSHPCCGAEALVRWNSKELGMVMPADFIPLAEYLGLILPIGEHVLREACRRCKFWNDFGHPQYSVNVNLSLVQLLQGNIVDTVQDVLIETGLFAQNLTLEVTESLAAIDADKIQKKLEELRELGVRLALDDFGTGYSSLGRLKDMPVDVLKIDKCFVDEMGRDHFSDAFIQSVSTLADSIDVDVVVEGVELESQQDAIRNMKVDMVQGYLYDKPLTKEEFEEKYLNV